MSTATPLSDEHQRIGLFAPEEIAGLVMPQEYKDSIATWLTQHAAAGNRYLHYEVVR